MAKSGRQFDFKSMEPRLRTIALVGRYLQVWSLMEIEVDDAIAKVLGMTGPQKWILSPNLNFSAKIYVLGSLLDMSLLDDKDKARHKANLNAMATYASRDRNKIAHVAFSQSPKSDGVRFLVVKAQGKLEAPDFDWSIQQFEDAFQKLGACRKMVVEMKDKIANFRPSLAQILASSWTTPFAPIEGPAGSSALSPPLLHPPTNHTQATTSATPETEDRTPQTPHE